MTQEKEPWGGGSPPTPLSVGILGATGSVGQKLVRLLSGHPWFRVTQLFGSSRSAGRTYGEVVRWLEPVSLPDWAADLVVKEPGAAAPVASVGPAATEARLDPGGAQGPNPSSDPDPRPDFIFSALDSKVAREIEGEFAEKGIPVNLLVAPVIPVLNDYEVETILKRAKAAGAGSASYVLLRLPHELKTLFVDWVKQEYPLKASHIMQRIKDCRGGREYDSAIGQRMQGKGLYADIIHNRFDLACKRLGYGQAPILNNALFSSQSSAQLALF